LIVLAAVAAYARLDAGEIIVVMAAGWLLASIFEVLAARRERGYPGATWERRVETGEPAPAAPEQPEEAGVSSSPPPAAKATPAAPEDAAVAEAASQPPSVPKVDDEATGEIALPSWRTWFRRGGSGPAQTADEAAARPSARHVRLIRESTPDDVEQRKDAEAG
jgi:hypothetical protein